VIDRGTDQDDTYPDRDACQRPASRRCRMPTPSRQPPKKQLGWSSLREQVNELRALHTYGRAGIKCACGRQHCQERQILYGEA